MRVATVGSCASGVYLSDPIPATEKMHYIFSFYVKGSAGESVIPTLEWISETLPTPTYDQLPATTLNGSWQLITLRRHCSWRDQAGETCDRARWNIDDDVLRGLGTSGPRWKWNPSSLFDLIEDGVVAPDHATEILVPGASAHDRIVRVEGRRSPIGRPWFSAPGSSGCPRRAETGSVAPPPKMGRRCRCGSPAVPPTVEVDLRRKERTVADPHDKYLARNRRRRGPPHKGGVLMHPAFREATLRDNRLSLDRTLRSAYLRRELERVAPFQIEPVTLRLAGAHDDDALDRLAELEGFQRSNGPHVVVEVEGTVHAAMPLGPGPALGDPFRPTAHLMSLLMILREQLAVRDCGSAPARLVRPSVKTDDVQGRAGHRGSAERAVSELELIQRLTREQPPDNRRRTRSGDCREFAFELLGNRSGTVREAELERSSCGVAAGRRAELAQHCGDMVLGCTW